MRVFVHYSQHLLLPVLLGELEKHVAAVVSGLPVMAMDWEMVELWDLS